MKLIAADGRKFIELANPPEFKVGFIKSLDTEFNRYRLSSQESDWQAEPVRVNNYTFGVKIEQPSSVPYNYTLTIEYFAIGTQRLDDSKYKLLDRNMETVSLYEHPARIHSFKGDPVELIDFNLRDSRRGITYYGHLVTVTDERGKIIHYDASNEWLYEQLDALKQILVGAFLNKQCKRVYPSGPKQDY